MIRSSLITYEGLPISSGGAHTLRKQSLKSQWVACENFLHSATDYRTPDEIHIVLHEGNRVSSNFSNSMKKELSRWLGRPVRRHTMSGVVNEDTNWWYPKSVPVSSLIDWFMAHQPFPDHWLNMPLVLGIKAHVRLKQPHGDLVLPYQDADFYLRQMVGRELYLGESQVYIRLTTKSTFFTFLSFPFLDTSEEFQEYLDFIEQELPFKLSSNHLIRWQLNAKGSHFYGRKLYFKTKHSTR
jgi:hypothetical protein